MHLTCNLCLKYRKRFGGVVYEESSSISPQ